MAILLAYMDTSKSNFIILNYVVDWHYLLPFDQHIFSHYSEGLVLNKSHTVLY